jgi:hypothetical protein
MKLEDWSPGTTVRKKAKWDSRGRLIPTQIGEFTSSEPVRMGYEDSRYSHHYAEVRWRDGRTFPCSLRNLMLVRKN